MRKHDLVHGDITQGERTACCWRTSQMTLLFWWFKIVDCGETGFETKKNMYFNQFRQSCWIFSLKACVLAPCQTQCLSLPPLTDFFPSSPVFKLWTFVLIRLLPEVWEWEQRPLFEITRSSGGQANKGSKRVFPGAEEEPLPLISTFSVDRMVNCCSLLWICVYFTSRVLFWKRILYATTLC